MKSHLTLAAAVAAATLSISALVRGADPAAGDPSQSVNPAQNADNAPVTREEYNRMLAEQRQMRAELEQLKRERAAAQAAKGAPAPNGVGASNAVTQEDLDEIDKTTKALRNDVDRFHPGTGEFLFAGDASFGFVSQHRNNSSFNAGLSPLILWKPADRLIFEGEFDLGLDTASDASSSTSIDLTIADATYLVTDWLAVGGGLFVTPFGVYHNHFDPSWINKFPDDPLAFSGSLAPGSSVGFFARGAFPVSTTKVTYDVYVTNGPNLIVSDPAAFGTLNWDNFSDLNNNKAVGGRIGFLPIPNLETGYSLLGGEAQPSGFHRVSVILQAFDINYRPELDCIAGTLDFRSEWVWSNIGRGTYDPDGSLGFGPRTFSSYSDGGYVQLCYRPTKVNNPILRNFEVVGRYDYLKVPIVVGGGDTEQRYTLGLDYWLNPQTVVKVAYEWDRLKSGGGEDALQIQVGIGL